MHIISCCQVTAINRSALGQCFNVDSDDVNDELSEVQFRTSQMECSISDRRLSYACNDPVM